MRAPTKLHKDGQDQYKLKVSLPGGRYQLSLDDDAIIVLKNELELSPRDVVPDAFVPFFVATKDAWFPKKRDTDDILQSLPEPQTLGPEERTALIEYITNLRIPKRNEADVRSVLENSQIADEVSPKDLQIQELPSLSDILAEPTPASVEHAGSERPDTTEPESAIDTDEDLIETFSSIQGIGTTRATALVSGGVPSLASLADARPADIQTIEGISPGIANVAVEGARELEGPNAPTSEQLYEQTGVAKDDFVDSLSTLAAAGVPASEAAPTLRVLYGPTVADVDAISGRQAYFLWKAGYQTPHDLEQATAEELTNVEYIGTAAADEIKSSISDE